jgi:hypothetical protein
MRRAGLAPQPDHHRSSERTEQLRQRVVAGATLPQIAPELGLTCPAVARMCRLHGLTPARRPRKPYAQRADMCPEAAIERPRRRWSEGASCTKIAAELGGGFVVEAVPPQVWQDAGPVDSQVAPHASEGTGPPSLRVEDIIELAIACQNLVKFRKKNSNTT